MSFSKFNLYVMVAILTSLVGIWFGRDCVVRLFNRSGKNKILDEYIGGMPLFSDSKEEKPEFKIALLVPALSPGIEEILDGFFETLRSEATFRPITRLYDAKGTRTLLRSHAEDILDTGYDAIFTVGVEPTKMIKEVSLRRNNQTPIVFTGVRNPSEVGITDSNSTITGVSATHNFELQIHLLSIVKKKIERVLIVYDPTQLGGQAIEAKNRVEELLEKLRIRVKAVEIQNVNEIEEKVSAYIDVTDVLITLHDHTARSGIDTLVKMCNNHGVTLFVSDTSLSEKGAALAFGRRERDLGSAAASKIRLILEDGKHPSQVPITDAGDYYSLLINAQAMRLQNVEIDDALLFIMKYSRVVGGKKQS